MANKQWDMSHVMIAVMGLSSIILIALNYESMDLFSWRGHLEILLQAVLAVGFFGYAGYRFYMRRRDKQLRKLEDLRIQALTDEYLRNRKNTEES